MAAISCCQAGRNRVWLRAISASFIFPTYVLSPEIDFSSAVAEINWGFPLRRVYVFVGCAAEIGNEAAVHSGNLWSRPRMVTEDGCKFPEECRGPDSGQVRIEILTLPLDRNVFLKRDLRWDGLGHSLGRKSRG